MPHPIRPHGEQTIAKTYNREPRRETTRPPHKGSEPKKDK